ncbi:hypothetical protein PAMP_021418 [Pampus punctatissimus]
MRAGLSSCQRLSPSSRGHSGLLAPNKEVVNPACLHEVRNRTPEENLRTREGGPASVWKSCSQLKTEPERRNA